MRQLQHVLAVHGHAREGLVDLDDVAVGDGEIVFGEELGDRDGGPDAHYAWREPGDGGAHVFGEDGLPEGDGAGAAHEEDCGGWGGGC